MLAYGWHLVGIKASVCVTRRLLERWEQHEKQLAEMRKKVEMLPPEEMEEILTPDEKNSIERIKRNINKSVFNLQ